MKPVICCEELNSTYFATHKTAMGPSVIQLVLGLISAFLYSHSGTETLNVASNGIAKGGRSITIGDETYVLTAASSRNAPETFNWADANRFCRDLYGKTGRLANADRQSTFLAIQKLVAKFYPGTQIKLWVDGLYNGSQFIWREKGIPVDQPWTQWGKGEPTKPFTLSRRVVWHQVSDTRAEFLTDDASSLYEVLCQHREPNE